MVKGGPKDHELDKGSKSIGCVKAGDGWVWWIVVAAMRTSWPENDKDCIGKLREMKEGWRRVRHLRCGGESMVVHFDEMGSYECSFSFWLWRLPAGRDNV